MKGITKTPKKRPLPRNVTEAEHEQGDTAIEANQGESSRSDSAFQGSQEADAASSLSKSAVVQSSAGAEQDDEDESDQEETAVKRMKVADQLTFEQEQELAEWFSENSLFYDQSLKEFKKRGKRDRLLQEKASKMGLTGDQRWSYT